MEYLFWRFEKRIALSEKSYLSRRFQFVATKVFISIFVQFVPSLVYLLNWNRQVREIWPTFYFFA